jgi:PIN domain nuclease of toxin-antitoxin system
MKSVVVDTHAVVWYFTDQTKLSTAALAAVEEATHAGDPIHLPSISLVEIRYLIEKGKLPKMAMRLLVDALDQPYANLQIAPLDLKVAVAIQNVPRDAVPDMPDRIIAATAFALGLPLVSRDRKIQASSIQTIW